MSFQKILKNSSGVPTGDYADVGSINYADNPIGTILPYVGTSAPSGWFLCQGQAISRTNYAELFAIIGTTFGSGDGSTTFNIPDLRGEFLRGAGTNSHTNQGNGGAVGEHQDATEVPYLWSHSDGVVRAPFSTGGANTVKNIDKQTVQSNNLALVKPYTSSAYTDALNYATRPTNTSVNYIIKAKMVALPADLAGGVEEYINDNATSEISSSNKLVTASDLSYSTSETKTGGTWINGKPIYRKVLEGTLISTPGTYFIQHGISNLDYVVNAYGMTAKNNDGERRQLDFAYYADQTWDCGLYVMDTQIGVQPGANFASKHGGKKIYVILEYTKTT